MHTRKLREKKHSHAFINRGAILVRRCADSEDEAVDGAWHAEVFLSHAQRGRQRRIRGRSRERGQDNRFDATEKIERRKSREQCDRKGIDAKHLQAEPDKHGDNEPAERVEQIDTEARRVIEKQTGDRVRRELHRDVDDLGGDFVKGLQAANERR